MASPRTRVLYAASSLGTEALTQSRGLWLVYFYAPPDDARRGPFRVAARPCGRGDSLCGAPGRGPGRRRDRVVERPHALAAGPAAAVRARRDPVHGALRRADLRPAAMGEVGTAVWLFVTLELFFLFSTLGGGPFEALLPELARTSHERVQIVGLQGLLRRGRGRRRARPERSAHRPRGIHHDGGHDGCARARVPVRWGRGRLGEAPRDSPPAEQSFRRTLRAAFGNPHFLRFLPSFVLFQVAVQMVLGALPYW